MDENNIILKVKSPEPKTLGPASFGILDVIPVKKYFDAIPIATIKKVVLFMKKNPDFLNSRIWR
jgi:hypothetical protein